MKPPVPSPWLAALALATVLGLSSAPAHAQGFNLEQIRQLLLELRGQIQNVIRDPSQLLLSGLCGDVRVPGGSALKSRMEGNGCWYTYTQGNGADAETTEFQIARTLRQASPRVMTELATEARRASQANINGRSINLDAEAVTETTHEQMGPVIWMAERNQLVYAHQGWVYMIRVRGQFARMDTAMQIASQVGAPR